MHTARTGYMWSWSGKARGLSLPVASRPAALHAHMKNWQRLMRTYGWKPNLMPRIGHDRLFCDFAFEVTLAVCAYDIDGSSFRDHPYYPRDLVDHYRQNLRHHRDGWRAEGESAPGSLPSPLHRPSALIWRRPNGVVSPAGKSWSATATSTPPRRCSNSLASCARSRILAQ